MFLSYSQNILLQLLRRLLLTLLHAKCFEHSFLYREFFWISEALFRNFVGLYSYYSKHLHLSLEYAMMESRDRVLRLNNLSFRLYSLAALGFSRSGFFYVRNRNSPTLQHYRNFHSYRLPSPNPYGPFEFWLSRSTLFSWLLIFYHRPDESTSVLFVSPKDFSNIFNFYWQTNLSGFPTG